MGLAEHLIFGEGKKVALLDLNFPSPRLHHYWQGDLFGEATPVNEGMVDYFLDYQRNEFQAPDSLADYCLPIKGSNSFIFPAGKEPGSEYVTKVLSIDYRKLASPEEPVMHGPLLMRHLQWSIEKEYDPEILLIDTPELISFLGNLVFSFMRLDATVWPKTEGDHSGRDIAFESLNFFGTESVVGDDVEQIRCLLSTLT
jgi:hypothetical protein